MRIQLEDLFCPTCRSYVHVFLEACPACGAPRTSRYEQAVAADPLAPDPMGLQVLDAASVAMRRHMLTSRGRGIGSTEVEIDPERGLDIAELFHRIAGVIKYRAVGLEAGRGLAPGTGRGGQVGGRGPATSAAEVRIRIDGDEMRLEEMRHRTPVASLSLSHVLSVTPVARIGRDLPSWAGIRFGSMSELPKPALPASDLLIVHVRDRAFVQLGLGNRTGVFASVARPDHYEELARWLGVIAGIEAEKRWLEIGPDAYLAELALARPSRPSATVTARPEGGGSPSVALALRELEALRAARLVTDDEYLRKRTEILDRL